MGNKKGNGGGKLERSEVVTVRLTKETKRLAELEAFKDRRTLSNWIECAIEKRILDFLNEIKQTAIKLPE